MSAECRRFDERFAALLADDDEELRRHLTTCAECRAEADAYRRTIWGLHQLDAANPAEGATPDGLHAGILRALDKPAPIARRPWRTFVIAGGLSAALAAAALLFFLRPHHHHPHRSSNPMPGVEALDGIDDEDPCHLIGDIDDEELAKVTAYFKKGV